MAGGNHGVVGSDTRAHHISIIDENAVVTVGTAMDIADTEVSKQTVLTVATMVFAGTTDLPGWFISHQDLVGAPVVARRKRFQGACTPANSRNHRRPFVENGHTRDPQNTK